MTNWCKMDCGERLIQSGRLSGLCRFTLITFLVRVNVNLFRLVRKVVNNKRPLRVASDTVRLSGQHP